MEKKRANQRKPYKTKKRKAKNKNDFTLNFVAANPSVRKFLGGAIQAQTMFLFCPWDLQFKAFAFPGAANLFDQWHMGSTPGKETIVFGDGGLQSGSRKWGFVADPELLKQTHKIQQSIGFVKQTQMNSVVETMEVGEVWAIWMGYWNSISWVLKKKTHTDYWIGVWEGFLKQNKMDLGIGKLWKSIKSNRWLWKHGSLQSNFKISCWTKKKRKCTHVVFNQSVVGASRFQNIETWKMRHMVYLCSDFLWEYCVLGSKKEGIKSFFMSLKFCISLFVWALIRVFFQEKFYTLCCFTKFYNFFLYFHVCGWI